MGNSYIDSCQRNLVGGCAIPLKNMSSSVGMMKFPIYGKSKTCSKPQTSHVRMPKGNTHTIWECLENAVHQVDLIHKTMLYGGNLDKYVQVVH